MISAVKAYHDTLERVSQKNVPFFNQVHRAIEEAIQAGDFQVTIKPKEKFKWCEGLTRKLHHLGYSPVFKIYGDDIIQSVELHWSNPKSQHITL